ncbi:MAG: hypothetical protein NTW03_03140 [Verrucomicrobia bacterium]|nr:hypothetical protein [Verrucomicrobiota bacterium]
MVRAFGVQQDGRVIVGGDFTQVGSTPRNRLARLVGTNGVLETGFAPSFNNSVFAIAVQTDGKILAGGLFTSVNNANVSFLARLNSDGTLDTNFNNGAGLNGAVNAIALQSDGSNLVAGGFTQAGGTNRNYMARLNGQGMLDATFDPGLGANGPVEAMGLAANGRILIGGDFSTYGGKSRNHVARLNSNGAVDLFFDPGTGPNSVVRALVVQPDTAVIIGGDFTSVNSIARNHIARLHGDENSNLIGVNFALATYTVAEDAGSALITVVRSGKTNLPCVIQYSTTDGTASNSVDYIGVTNSLSFALGQVSNSFSVRILDDGLAAGDKSLNLSLASTAPNVDVSGLSSAILVILDKEKYVKFSLTNYVAWENSANAIINLVRGGGLSSTAAVTFVTSGGTAVPGSNYVSVSNVVVFAAGQSNQTVLIPLIDDIIVGGDKTVGLRLTNAVNCVLLEPSNAVLHILDNDVPYATFNYSNPAAITILDASAASPYPSVINVSSLFGVVAKATVTLVNVNHTFPSDIQVLLVGPGGQTNVLLMSDAGSHYGLVNTTLQFDDTALGNLPASAPIVSDTYRPTDYPPTETFPPGAPTPPYGPVLSVLNGMIPNGTWSLYVMDAHGPPGRPMWTPWCRRRGVALTRMAS